VKLFNQKNIDKSISKEKFIPLEAIREIVVNSFAHMKVSPAILNEKIQNFYK